MVRIIQFFKISVYVEQHTSSPPVTLHLSASVLICEPNTTSHHIWLLVGNRQVWGIGGKMDDRQMGVREGLTRRDKDTGLQV